MLLDARTVTAGSTLSTDVCIVGGGPAGVTLALELAQVSSAEVLLLEGGGLVEELESAALAQGENVGYPLRGALQSPQDLTSVRARALGGGTNWWAGCSRPLTEAELGPQAQQPVSSWPITATELDPWYRAAHEKIRLGPYDYDAASWSQRLSIAPPLDLGPDLETCVYQMCATRFGSQYLPLLGQSTQVTLLHHANATAVNVDPAGTTATGLIARTLTGVEVGIEASAVVLATGGIDVPRLLLASNDVLPMGIGNEHDLVGRYYADHLAFTYGFLRLRPSPYDARLYAGHLPLDTTTPAGAPTSISVQASLQVHPSTCDREAITGTHIEMNFEFLPAQAAQTTGTSMPDIDELLHAAGGGPTQSAVGFRAFIEQIANPDSRVQLSPVLDALGAPRAQLDWRLSPADQSNAERGMEIVGSSLGARGLGRLQHAAGWVGLAEPLLPDKFMENLRVSPSGDVPSDIPFETTFHHMCTTRMDIDPSQGVVDTNCRVHTVDNLYIASSSVFPVPVGHYPTITVIALAIRLAHHLAGEASP